MRLVLPRRDSFVRGFHYTRIDKLRIRAEIIARQIGKEGAVPNIPEFLENVGGLATSTPVFLAAVV